MTLVPQHLQPLRIARIIGESLKGVGEFDEHDGDRRLDRDAGDVDGVDPTVLSLLKGAEIEQSPHQHGTLVGREGDDIPHELRAAGQSKAVEEHLSGHADHGGNDGLEVDGVGAGSI